MTKDRVLAEWRKRPFAPFRIITVVGEKIDVMHPNLMLVAGEIISVGSPDPKRPPPAASDGVWLEFGDIAEVEPLTSATQR